MTSAPLPDAGANWDGIIAALETRLAEVERTGGEFPEVRAELDRGRAFAQSHRSTVAAARTGAERDSKLVALGLTPKASTPEELEKLYKEDEARWRQVIADAKIDKQ